VSTSLINQLAAVIERLSPLKERSRHETQSCISAAKLLLDIPAPNTYDEWATVGVLIHAHTNGSRIALWLFDQWSRQSPRYTAEGTLSLWDMPGNAAHNLLCNKRPIAERSVATAGRIVHPDHKTVQ
jgi:hypothetical protein